MGGGEDIIPRVQERPSRQGIYRRWDCHGEHSNGPPLRLASIGTRWTSLEFPTRNPIRREERHGLQ